jgi:hypothetical protein
MEKLKRSWALLKCSVYVVGTNKKLLLFPILTMVFTAIAIMFFIMPVLFWSTGNPYDSPEHWRAVINRWIEVHKDIQPGQHEWSLRPTGYILAAAIYLFSTFLATFFNVAFYSQILRALTGAPVSLVEGLHIAVIRIKPILVWSLFTGVIGLIIRSIEERVGSVGKWIASLIGAAWTVACVFVVPAIILQPETLNPVDYLKTSASILKRTWGEALVGYIGIQFFGMLLVFGSMAFLIAGIVLSSLLHSGLVFAVFAIIWFVGLIGLSYLSNVASQVYRGALYLYAANDIVPAPFTEDQMAMAWKYKKNKGD